MSRVLQYGFPLQPGNRTVLSLPVGCEILHFCVALVPASQTIIGGNGISEEIRRELADGKGLNPFHLPDRVAQQLTQPKQQI